MRLITKTMRRTAVLSALTASLVCSGAVPAMAQYRSLMCDDCYGCYRPRCYDDCGYGRHWHRHYERHRVGYTTDYGDGYPYYGENSYPDWDRHHHRHHEWRDRDDDDDD